jgi:ribose transport system ATP-binding protein
VVVHLQDPGMQSCSMPPILCLEAVTKIYPGVVALDSVDFAVESGEVRALVGKNGAGKSTLVKVLSGAVTPDSGEIRVDGVAVRIDNPIAAFELGICTVYQELSLVPGLTVAENITLGRWPHRRPFGISLVDRAETRKAARAALDRLEVELDLDETVSRLSVAEQQLIEIAKAISFDLRVLILDEPTSALASTEVETLHRVVRRLAAQGHGVIYVTHRLQEVPDVADSVTVLRDGRCIGTISAADATPARIANMMIGADWQRTERVKAGQTGEVALSVRNLTRKPVLTNVSFELRAGEVLGIAGLLGSGRTELVRAVFGRDPIDAGEVWVNGCRVSKITPRAMKALGVGFTPEDRKRQGLILLFSTTTNLTLASFNRISALGLLHRREETALAQQMVGALQIKVPNLSSPTANLSGGNQQKVTIGKWLNTLPEVLLMDEPTRGIDIHAKEQIFGLVRDLASRGLAVLFISSEIEEVLDVADRILVMSHGRITAEVLPEDVSLEELLELVMQRVDV